MQWQPIETAPKDGSAVLVYADQATVPLVRFAWWDDGENWEARGFSCRDEAAGWWFSTSSCGSERLWWEPTHWMLLPEPPPAD